MRLGAVASKRRMQEQAAEYEYQSRLQAQRAKQEQQSDRIKG